MGLGAGGGAGVVGFLEGVLTVVGAGAGASDEGAGAGVVGAAAFVEVLVLVALVVGAGAGASSEEDVAATDEEIVFTSELGSPATFPTPLGMAKLEEVARALQRFFKPRFETKVLTIGEAGSGAAARALAMSTWRRWCAGMP